MIVVTGFGPFGEVDDNPSARLARALHGHVAGGHRVVGWVLPVRWAITGELAPRLRGARLVVGTGVAVRRTEVAVERTAQAAREGVDVEGAAASPRDGPERHATLDVARLARLLDAQVSEDAGRYLCNAWLYDVPAQSPAPTGFVHIPPSGLAPERMLRALEALVDR